MTAPKFLFNSTDSSTQTCQYYAGALVMAVQRYVCVTLFFSRIEADPSLLSYFNTRNNSLISSLCWLTRQKVNGDILGLAV